MRMLGFSLASWPEVGCRLPAMICSCVVLPAPLMPAGKAGQARVKEPRVRSETEDPDPHWCHAYTVAHPS